MQFDSNLKLLYYIDYEKFDYMGFALKHKTQNE